MAAILASHSCYCRNVEWINQGRIVDNISFSSSVSIQNVQKLERHTCNLPKTEKVLRFCVEAQQAESHKKYGTNGRAINMVPTSEIMRRKPASTENAELVNGSKRVAHSSKQVVSGMKQMVNVASLRETSALVKNPSIKKPDEFSPTEELKVLRSDENFIWANENYNYVQRSIDVWSFVISLRVRILLDNAKWSYLGGFTRGKQVSLVFPLLVFYDINILTLKHKHAILSSVSVAIMHYI